jgi:hypothetical protein
MIGGLSQSGGPLGNNPPTPKPPVNPTPPEPSIWGRLGQLAKDTGWALAAPARFAWDVATAAGNDDEAYNGIRNTFTSAGGQFLGRVIKPLADVSQMPVIKPALEKLDTVNRELIREPLTTAELMYIEKSNPFDGSAWAEAHKQAQTTSFGQGFVGALGAAFPKTTEMLSNAGFEENVNEVDWNDPKSVDNYFNHGSQKFWSGFADTGIQIFGDVSIAGGKAAKALRGAEAVSGGLSGANRAEKIATAIQNVSVAEDGLQVNKYSRLLDDFAKNDSLYAYNHPMLKDSPARATIAHALGEATTPKDAGLVVRAGLGDPNALDEIRAVGRADLANPIGKSLGEIDAIDQWGLKGEKLSDGSPKFAWEDDSVHAEIGAEKLALESNNAKFNKFWALQEIASTPGGVLTRTVGATPFQSVDRFVAEGRATKFYDLPSTSLSKTEVFQPTPFHRMYQFVSWGAGERPAGIVNLNDAESSREVSAVLKRAMKVANISDEHARTMLDRYLGSFTPEQRAEAVYFMEREIFGQLALKHGLTTETADAVYNNYKRARATAYSSLKERGYAVDLDGTVFKAPLFESQTANVLPMMDFDMANSVLRRHNLLKENAGIKQAMGWMLDGGSDAISMLDTMQSLFKVGSLLRLGYMTRNSIEAQLRIASSLGATTSFRHLGKGMSNLIYNTGTAAKRQIDKLNPLSKTMGYEDYKVQLDTTGQQIQEIEKKISHIKDQIQYDRNTYKDSPGVHEGHYDDPSRLADIDIFETLLAEKKAMYDKTNEHLADLEKGKHRMASGTYEYTGIDGTKYTLPEAFGGPYGPIHWDNSSSENSYLSLVDRQSKMLSSKMIDTGFGAIAPEDPNYWIEWDKTINNQFGNSLVVRKLAAGQNPYEVATWLRNNPSGRILRGRLGLDKEEAKDYVLTAKNILDQYLPDAGLQSRLAERTEISSEMLRSAFTDPNTLPTIHGHVIAENLNLVGVKKSKNLINGAFKLIGSMPEDAWARHPVYAELYRRSLEQRINDFTALNGRPVSNLPDELISSSEMDLAMRAAHADALRGTKQLLFTIDRKTNLASYMKYLSPFFSAYENSIKTWAKLAYEKPQIINRANLVFTAPNRAGIATDANGKPVDAQHATMDDYLWIQVPSALKKLPFGVGKGLSSLDHMGVQKRSLDVIFQGSTEIPVGPYVAIPVSEIVKNQPTFEDSLKWAIPFGPSRSAVEGLLPGWVRRQMTKAGGQSDPQYANTYALIWQTEQHKRKSQGLPPLSDKQIKDLTNSFYNMRTVANLVLPFAPTFTSPYKYYIDQYRQYQEKYKQDAPTEFWKTYGDDFFDFTMSLSKNNAGIGSSVDDVANAKKYNNLVSEVSHLDPKLIGLITSNGQGAYKFSQAAYMWEQQNTVSPGSDLTFRGRQSPQESAKDNETKLGWIKYRKAISQLDAILDQRGLTSYQQKGAEDLQYVKSQVITELGKQNNSWYDDYNSNNRNGYQNVIKTFNLALSDKKFMADHGNDSTWKSISLFLDARKQIANILAKQDVKSIDSKANAPLRFIYDDYVNKLKKEDIGFADIYDRYFSNDPVYDKVYTEGSK